MRVMEGAWWTFFKWLRVAFFALPSFWSLPLWTLLSKLWRSVWHHAFYSLHVQLVIKWTRMLLACVVVLEDPLT